jgi:hydroxymethylpyrimidine/phosphomethylpyrimidine kinase
LKFYTFKQLLSIKNYGAFDIARVKNSFYVPATLVYLFLRGYNPMMKFALTIAGSDPSGGAGIQADLKVFRSLGSYGLSAIASLTAQNSAGVKDLIPVNSKFIEEQLKVLMADFRPDALKTGMLYSEANVYAVAKIVTKYSLDNFVIDPVMISSSGRRLTEKAAQTAIREKLLPLSTVITPNIHEASVLAGMEITTIKDMEKAAVRLRLLGAQNVIITGGHLEDFAVDVVFNGEFHYMRSRKIPGEYHGTGCTFSAAVTALLAKGHSVPDAARLAKKFMNMAFRKSFSTGSGMRLFDI